MGGSRSEKMREKGEGRGTMGSGGLTPGLDAPTLALVRIATATATGDESTLRERMIAARAADVPAAWVEELLLQGFLNVGYPLTLVAFAVWREVAGPPKDVGEPIAHPEWARWTERGCRRAPRCMG